MKIKRIEIAGFKSFADRVVLDFQQGVTGVVGPNGCGKSNIVDAIRWCMGEQSARNLRGKAMEDVIFAGSEQRKPLGMAEVSLVFSTEDGRAPSKYLEFSEIQLTRRLYRDGESEYLINKTPCRLLDIAELFMDTGVGTRAYSIIEQGKIGQILHSRPEERRLLIEEAAGVTKYKVRKQLALRKLDATRQNLLRLDDLLGEVRRQLQGLQRQAKKAQRFKECREELRTLDLQFTVRQADALQQQLQQLDGRSEEFLQHLQQTRTAAEKAEHQVELQRLALVDAERELNAHQEALYGIRSEATRCESGLLFRRREAESLVERRERLHTDHRRLEAQQADLEREQGRLSELLQTAEQALTEGASCLEGLQAEQQVQEESLELLNRSLEALRRERFAAAGEAAQCRSRHETATKRLADLEERRTRNQAEQLQLAETLQAQRQRLEGLAAEQQARRLEHQATLLTADRLAADEQALQTRLPELERQVGERRNALSAARSRLASLQELEAQFAGYGQGVRRLMTESPLRGRLAGLLADHLTVPPEYEAAVEAVLADRLQTVICDSEDDLAEALTFLRDQQAGRAHLAAPHPAPVDRPAIPGAVPLMSVAVAVGRAASQISRMLAAVHLVDDLRQALEMSRSHPDQTFVTPGGDVVAPDGTVSGGAIEPVQSGIIHKKREMRELEESVQTESLLLAADEQQFQQVRAAAQQLAQQLLAMRGEQHRLELTLAGLQKDRQQLEADNSRLAERIELLGHDRTTLEEERIGLQQEQTDAASGLALAEQRAVQLDQELTALQTQSEGKRLLASAAREAVTAQRVATAKLSEQVDGYRRARHAVSLQLAELTERRRTGDIEQGTLTGQLETIRQQIAEDEQRLAGLLDEQRRREEQLQEIRSCHEAAAAQLAALEQAARTCREKRDAAHQRHAELSLQRSGLEMQYELVHQSLHERYRIHLAEARERVGETPPDESEALARQAELQKVLDEIGEVNLMAIEEYAGTEQRYEFLASQKADLEESLQDLQQAINRINRTTRKRFLETFTQVNQKFQEVFPRLFCGGKAELRLTDEQDLLETGIEIVVQPPGKKLSNVMLLSGGEKALTAVALIFAIFLIKPTPFCLLDEVDAPLDDANIGRFNEMVREMSAISQFIIITHNKATMAVADTLYGVTMEEPGASRLVSVRLH